jgi:amidophosphoribosyltransferase
MCGFVGIVGETDCAVDIQLALQALQHRGQDSAGIGTLYQDQFPMQKSLGLVSQGLRPEVLQQLPGSIGVGQVRYPTVGKGLLRDAQPFFYRQPGVLMAHNGNFINVREMQALLKEDSVHLLSQCDVEPVMCLFALELMKRRRRDHTIEDAVQALDATFRLARGAYSIVAALILDGEPTMMVVRDPFGIRPVVWGQRNGMSVAVSESVALDVLEVPTASDVFPGEAMFFRASKKPVRCRIGQGNPAPCIFEYIYFARPDSTMNGQSVYGVRMALGKELAHAWKEKGLSADVVIPIPDTARPSAAAFSEELGLPVREGFIKNRYTGRTFIMPTADQRANTLKLKLNPISSEFRGKKVLVIDDSIVRGTTLDRTIRLIREQGAVQVHLAIYSPPVIHPCYYGIDMSTQEELLAHRFLPKEPCGSMKDDDQKKMEKELAMHLGLDSLTYLPFSGLSRAYPAPCCAACFNGDYPLPITEKQRSLIEEDRRIFGRTHDAVSKHETLFPTVQSGG